LVQEYSEPNQSGPTMLVEDTSDRHSVERAMNEEPCADQVWRHTRDSGRS
jgi:hypothetical protein